MNPITLDPQSDTQTAQTIEIQDERSEQRVPNFTLPATNGDNLSLYKFAGRKRVILFFPASADDQPSRAYARKLGSARQAWNDVDAVVLPVLNADIETVRAWAQENAQGYASAADTSGSVRNRYYDYFEVDPAHALLVLLNLYCAPLVISHGVDANGLMPPQEIEQWLNRVAFACSE